MDWKQKAETVFSMIALGIAVGLIALGVRWVDRGAGTAELEQHFQMGYEAGFRAGVAVRGSFSDDRTPTRVVPDPTWPPITASGKLPSWRPRPTTTPTRKP